MIGQTLTVFRKRKKMQEMGNEHFSGAKKSCGTQSLADFSRIFVIYAIEKQHCGMQRQSVTATNGGLLLPIIGGIQSTFMQILNTKNSHTLYMFVCLLCASVSMLFLFRSLQIKIKYISIVTWLAFG